MTAVDLGRLLDGFPGAELADFDPHDLDACAIAYACGGWEVFPLRGKAPAHPKREGGQGVLDATSDPAAVARWWQRYPGANIGGRVPAGCFVLDSDPRKPGHRPLDVDLGTTRTALSGRGDGGCHRYYRHPGGKIATTDLPGWDIKTHAGYCVLPPSVHPDTGGRYRWVDPAAPIVSAPAELVALLRPPAPPPPPARDRVTDFLLRGTSPGDSPADWFTSTTTWRDVLGPHGWYVVAGDGEHDGSAWRHPAATSPLSATVRHGLLFVYTTSTDLPVTEAGAPAGLTRFRAWAHLEHHGDLSAAARAARGLRGGTAT